jgi:hypothetical protein
MVRKSVMQLVQARSKAQRRAARSQMSRISRSLAVGQARRRAINYGRSAGELKSYDLWIAPDYTGATSYGLFPVGSVTSGDPSSVFVGITSVNVMQQGATNYQRVGAKVSLKSLHVQAYTTFHYATVGTAHLRFLVVYDKNPNKAYPVLSDIISDNISGTTYLTSQINNANRDRFVILRNKVVNVVSATSGRTAMIDEFIPLGGYETRFASSTASIGDITSGAIYVIAFSDITGTASQYVSFDCHTRLRYID